MVLCLFSKKKVLVLFPLSLGLVPSKSWSCSLSLGLVPLVSLGLVPSKSWSCAVRYQVTIVVFMATIMICRSHARHCNRVGRKQPSALC